MNQQNSNNVGRFEKLTKIRKGDEDTCHMISGAKDQHNTLDQHKSKHIITLKKHLITSNKQRVITRYIKGRQNKHKKQRKKTEETHEINVNHLR